MDINSVIFKSLFYLTLAVRREWFLGNLKDLESSQFLTRQNLEELQQQKLKAIVEHARSNIPFYRERINSRYSYSQAFRSLPLLEKSVVRNSPESFRWKSSYGQRLKTSGGSTGAPLSILKDSKGMSQELAAAWRAYRWAGINIGDRQARFWGIPRNRTELNRAKVIDFICNRKRITAFGYDDKSFQSALSKLIKFQPTYCYGYVSLLREFSEFVQNNDLDDRISINSVIATSEVLSPVDRAIIERGFRAKVFNEYGCGEVGTIAHECEYGGLHVNCENIFIEIVDEELNNVSNGEQGEIVVTDLTNYSMPLLRYRLNDWGILSDTNCPCGRGLPLISKILGRQYDTLLNTKGKKFHGEFFLYIIEDLKKTGININAVQFLQANDLSVKVKINCASAHFDEAKEFIKKRLSLDFDQHVIYDVEMVDRIERESSGKLRVVKKEECKSYVRK